MPISIHLNNQQHRLRRASMFGARHFHSLVSLQIRSMWQPQQQLRCLSPADHVQRVLQQISCQHLQKLRPMPTNYFAEDRKSRMNDQGKYLRVKSNRLNIYGIGVSLYGNNLHQFSREVQIRASHIQSYRSWQMRSKVPEMTNALFNGIFPADNVITAVLKQKNHGTSIRSTCLSLQHGYSMVHTGSVSYSSP